MLESIVSMEMILAHLHPPLNNLETLYNLWFLSGRGEMGLNHSTYARYVGTCMAHKDGEGKICAIAVLGIWKTT